MRVPTTDSGSSIPAAGRPARSHPSRSAEADGHLSALVDDGYAAAAGESDHSLELSGVRLDVDVSERNLATSVVLTGRRRVRSGVFPEDAHDLGHGATPFASGSASAPVG